MGEIYHLTDERFARYGRVLPDLQVDQLVEEAGKFIRNFDGVRYERSLEVLEVTEDFKKIQKWFGGEAKLQCGLCWGHNVTMDAVEYHRSSEINVGAEDMVLMLGDMRDVKNNTYKSAALEFFFVPKGTAVELFGTTLHYAPCQASEEGFSTVVILPDMTNAPLSEDTVKKIPGMTGEDRLLFGNNKWVIAHPDCSDVKNSFAYPGIIGENRKIGKAIQL